MTREVLEPEILKRFTRYNVYKPTIVLSANAPKPTGDMVIDSKGVYIKAEQLTNIIYLGGLLEFTQELKDLMQDGLAQQALLRDLTALGYKDFMEVMTVLKAHKEKNTETPD